MSRMQTVQISLLLMISVVLCGCMDEQPADVTGTVTGRVTFDGQPVPYGAIVFQNEQEGTIASMRLDQEGNYKLRFAGGLEIPAGEYVVTVQPPDVMMLSIVAGELRGLDPAESLSLLEAPAANADLISIEPPIPSVGPVVAATDAIASVPETENESVPEGDLEPRPGVSESGGDVHSVTDPQPTQTPMSLPPELEAARASDFPMIPHQFRHTASSPLRVTVTHGENNFSVDLNERSIVK
jgi:hypothetical protein